LSIIALSNRHVRAEQYRANVNSADPFVKQNCAMAVDGAIGGRLVRAPLYAMDAGAEEQLTNGIEDELRLEPV
jgi:hypothetical protein